MFICCTQDVYLSFLSVCALQASNFHITRLAPNQLWCHTLCSWVHTLNSTFKVSKEKLSPFSGCIHYGKFHGDLARSWTDISFQNKVLNRGFKQQTRQSLSPAACRAKNIPSIQHPYARYIHTHNSLKHFTACIARPKPQLSPCLATFQPARPRLSALTSSPEPVCSPLSDLIYHTFTQSLIQSDTLGMSALSPCTQPRPMQPPSWVLSVSGAVKGFLFQGYKKPLQP